MELRMSAEWSRMGRTWMGGSREAISVQRTRAGYSLACDGNMSVVLS